MKEKNRKSTRFTANFDGYFRLKSSYDWQECFIYDISETGTLIRMKQTLIVDDILEICLNKENTDDIIIGTVANVQGQVVGVEFSTTDMKNIIDKAIHRAFSKTRTDKKRYGI